MSKKCDYCNYDLNKDWKFCPNCGKEIRSFKNYLNVGMEDIINKVMKDFGDIFGNILLNSGMPKVEIRLDKIPYKPEKNNEDKTKEYNEEPKRDIEKILDPKMIIKNKNDSMTIELNMPEIESMEDITIKEYKESVEVKAYFDKNMYFKIISIPENKAIENISFENGILKIIINE